MADKEIIDLPAVEIADLPTAESVADDILIPCYVPGSTDPAQNVTGAQLRAFAEYTGELAGAEAGRKAAADLQKGDKGDTPVKGVDYWTAEDQAAIVAEVLSQMPEDDGSEETLTALLEELTVEFTDGEAYLEAATPLVVGETYTVLWDGVEYECVAKELDIDGVVTPYIGNDAILGVGEDNGQPFFVMYGSAEATGSTAVYAFFTADTADTHTVGICQVTRAPELPVVTSADDGKFLRVVDGAWAAVALDSAEGASF